MTREKNSEPAASDWRLVGLDIDGTLMKHGGEITSAVVDIVEQVRMCRTHTVLATGRNIIATVPVAHALGIRRGWAVCSNGAVTIRLNPGSPGGYDIAEVRTFEPRVALELVRRELPDAFVAVEDLGVGFRVAKEFPMGELVGRQRVVGFDDVPEAAYLFPSLTTVRQDFAALGELIMQKVLVAVEEPDSVTEDTPLPTHLIVRQSTGSPESYR